MPRAHMGARACPRANKIMANNLPFTRNPPVGLRHSGFRNRHAPVAREEREGQKVISSSSLSSRGRAVRVPCSGLPSLSTKSFTPFTSFTPTQTITLSWILW